MWSLVYISRVIKSRRTRLAGHVVRMGRADLHTAFYWGDPRKRALGRLKRSWDDNIKMCLQEVR